MNGKVVEKLAHALDQAAESVGHDNPEKLPEHLLTGRRGEDYFHLRRLGYVMVARNWRSARHRGELDLVSSDGDVLCFIEVKTHTTRYVAPAEAAVDEQKCRDLGAGARDFRRRVKGEPPVRFELVSVYYTGTEKNSPDITLFKYALPMP